MPSLTRSLLAFAAVAGLLAMSLATAQPLATDHPLIGTWVITAPNGCAETYVVRPDGTATITSADEVAESQLTISPQPSTRGFFKWTEKVLKANGKKDCSGEPGEAGRESVSYILLNQDKSQFAMCEREDRSACIGPFKRAK
jgi:hypothetical protein